MVIDEKMLQDDLYGIMLKQVKNDFSDGLFDDHLLTLWNMSSHLSFLKEKDLINVWVNYRVQQQIQKLYRTQPNLFAGFKRIIGQERIEKTLALGGFFVTFQYGHDRFIPITIANKLKGEKKFLNRIMDSATFHLERKYPKWDDIHQLNLVDELISDRLGSDLKIPQLITKKESLFFYLDGRVGYDDAFKPVHVEFLSSMTKIPTSIFRLAVKFHKPICLVLATTNDKGEAQLIAHDLMWMHDNTMEDDAQLLYHQFETLLLEKPEHWKNWDKPNDDEVKSLRKKKMDSQIDVYNRWGTRGFSFQSREMYDIASS
ncbi:hypothetical protein [Evansella tamaricis]|uniref:Uncharacterized protein n=1 Tax=Evansella tamaricis TaxID=2069301 RepID=A0ABS6JJP3_9BACI|nr:hypothetical protein [Evansella tamaricis]MBU9713610.1 hypothetical protein [Evansella tamaricis]